MSALWPVLVLWPVAQPHGLAPRLAWPPFRPLWPEPIHRVACGLGLWLELLLQALLGLGAVVPAIAQPLLRRIRDGFALLEAGFGWLGFGCFLEPTGFAYSGCAVAALSAAHTN